jgi:putative ABC transport system permease protein
MKIPLTYNLRSLFVRKGATLLTVLGIGATVAVVAGVLALQQGFARMFSESGDPELAVFLRPGANYESESLFTRDRALQLVKNCPEILVEDDQPLASMECFIAVLLQRVAGGKTNVPVRGVQEKTFDLRRDSLEMTSGRRFAPGTDEVVVGDRLLGYIRGCAVDDVIVLNTTPFRVVGSFRTNGPEDSEIWGDLDRMLAALNRLGPNRVIARLQPGTDFEALRARLESDKQVPAKVLNERDYLTGQTGMLSTTLLFLGGFLGVIMGIAAVFTATNTMLSAVAARTHEIGILLATGFRPFPIFLSFLFEALLLGLLGGVAGCLMTLPLNGVETGTTNFQTFTEVAFGFRVTPKVLATAVQFALVLGLLGGAIPAWKASRLKPVDALRRG